VREAKEKILQRLQSVASVDESDDKQKILMRLKSVTSEEESDGRRYCNKNEK
jgi:hypothetical protein